MKFAIKDIFTNKKKALICNFLFILLILSSLAYGIFRKENVTLEIEYGEAYSSDTYAQLFWAPSTSEFDVNSSMMSPFQNSNIADFESNVGFFELYLNMLRIDMINAKEEYKIRSLDFYYNNTCLKSYSGKELEQYVSIVNPNEWGVEGDELTLKILNKAGFFVLSSEFSHEIGRAILNVSLVPFYTLIALYVLFGIAQILCVNTDMLRFRNPGIRYMVIIVSSFSFFAVFLTVYMRSYLMKQFAEVPLAQIIYHLHAPLEGTNVSTFNDIFLTLAGSLGISIGLACILYVLLWKFKKSRVFFSWLIFGSISIIVYQVFLFYIQMNVPGYLKFINKKSTIYETFYVDGRDVDLIFPEKKNNLIYIFLESMETTYADAENGGAMKNSLIPELANITQSGECFGDGTLLNGGHQVPGASFTMGALVAQTAGVPINESLVSNSTLNDTYESDSNIIPGVWAIGDILNDQGYNQEFLIGSDGKFAGRSSYFKGHGNYNIFDYYTAIDKELIPEEYWVWWGYEDAKLFDYAKEELKNLSSQSQPFNLTMLTVDTHFTDGYVCEYCAETEDAYDEQYSDVIACSSRQIAGFVQWVSQQDFYDNTVIVLAGDHLTMDSAYIARHEAEAFDRRTIFTIINGKNERADSNTERKYTTMDAFPTTLASLGVEIAGNRLGLGTNLYSDEDTLLEKLGKNYLNEELQKNSDLYKEKLLYKN